MKCRISSSQKRSGDEKMKSDESKKSQKKQKSPFSEKYGMLPLMRESQLDNKLKPNPMLTEMSNRVNKKLGHK